MQTPLPRSRGRFSCALGSIALSNPFRNILRLATGDFISKALSFLAFVYLARVLGVSEFGVLEFAGSILTYLLLISDGGLEMWGTREAAKAGDLPALVKRVLPYRLLLASGSFALLLVVLPLFPHYPSLRVVMVLYAVDVFAQAISLKWAFMGQQDMSRVARGLVIGQMLFALAVFGLIHNAAGLVWVPVLRLAGDLATAIYFARWYRRIHGHLPLQVKFSGLALGPALTLGLSQAMGLINYNFDSVLLGFLRGPTVVGWYNAAYKLILISVTPTLTYVVGLFPALSRSYAESREEFRHLMARSVELWLAYVVPLVVGGVFLADSIIHFLYGTAYANSAAPLRILVWSAALASLRMVYSNALRATGHQALDLRCAIASAALNVVLNVLFIPRYGMVGAASATVSADVIWFAASYYFFARVVLPGEPMPKLRGPLLGGLAMAVVLWVARPVVWPARAILGLATYALILIILGGFSLRQYLQKPPGA